MIKYLYICFIILPVIFCSCKETVEPDTADISSPAKNLVINELFRIDSAKYYSHWWIELYNPTDSNINITSWKIGFTNSNVTINLYNQLTITNFEKGTFLLITSDANVFNDYWNVAPLTTLLQFKTTFSALKPTEEIQLIDGNNDVISILRYGNFVSFANDQFPNNKSFGNVQEWHSICRYADPKGAFNTNNSANDFFEEPNPIAGYYSQRMKK
jgi:hypothetical protein